MIVQLILASRLGKRELEDSEDDLPQHKENADSSPQKNGDPSPKKDEATAEMEEVENPEKKEEVKENNEPEKAPYDFDDDSMGSDPKPAASEAKISESPVKPADEKKNAGTE